jgi:hypothetical protein
MTTEEKLERARAERARVNKIFDELRAEASAALDRTDKILKEMKN